MVEAILEIPQGAWEGLRLVGWIFPPSGNAVDSTEFAQMWQTCFYIAVTA